MLCNVIRTKSALGRRILPLSQPVSKPQTQAGLQTGLHTLSGTAEMRLDGPGFVWSSGYKSMFIWPEVEENECPCLSQSAPSSSSSYKQFKAECTPQHYTAIYRQSHKSTKATFTFQAVFFSSHQCEQTKFDHFCSCRSQSWTK